MHKQTRVRSPDLQINGEMCGSRRIPFMSLCTASGKTNGFLFLPTQEWKAQGLEPCRVSSSVQLASPTEAQSQYNYNPQFLDSKANRRVQLTKIPCGNCLRGIRTTVYMYYVISLYRHHQGRDAALRNYPSGLHANRG